MLAFGLYGLALVLFATFPVLDRMMRNAGRPDLALLAPFVVAPSLAALTATPSARSWPAAVPATPSAGCCSSSASAWPSAGWPPATCRMP